MKINLVLEGMGPMIHDHPIAFFHLMSPPQPCHVSDFIFSNFYLCSSPASLAFSPSLDFPGNRWKTTRRSTPMTSASYGGHQDAAEESVVNQSEKRPISSVLIIIAMQTEALALANKFQLSEDVISVFRKEVSWVWCQGTYKDLHLDLVWPGKDRALGVDSVGTVSASLLTYASIQALQPDLIINAGTAGGFKAKGACIADVYLASDCAFHDRRIPIPVFDLYGVGLRQALSTPNLIKELNLKVGKLSTGDSLDMCSQDEESIVANDATIKDMEGAAVAYVADLFKIPVIFMKAVTDIVDGEKPTAEEFLKNLAIVAAALDQAVTQVIDYISGKCISDL